MKNYRILNLVGLIIVLATNALANILPINGLNTGEISDRYPNLFVPAGFTFSIWGLIYLLLIGWVIYFLYPPKRGKEAYEKTDIKFLFFYSCIANSSWILAWHYLQIQLSFIIMLGILSSLVFIYQRIINKNLPWVVKVPISVYLGWICVATIANLTALLVHYNFHMGEYASWFSALMIIVSVLLGLFFLFKKKDVFFSSVIVWALIGILANHDILTIQYTCYFGIAILTVGILITIFRKKIYLTQI